MICKYCFAELEDGTTVCPMCGKELAEAAEELALTEEMTEEEIFEEEEKLPEEETKKEKKRMSKGCKKALAITGIVVLAIVLTGAVLYYMGYGRQVIHTLKFWRANDINYKLSYSVKDETAEKKADTVVATLGNQKLTNGELQAYYWMNVYEFMDYYGYYLSMMGLDVTKPLANQIFDEKTGQTYQQMFLSNALQDWRTYATLTQMSEDANFTLTEQQQEYLKTVEDQIKEMATEMKYTDVELFVDKELFPGSSLNHYLQYVKVNHVGLCYYDALYASFMPNEQEIEDYYLSHELAMKEQGFGKDDGDYYGVRHILVEIEGGTQDTDGSMIYTDAEWEACRASAQKLLDDFLANDPTEDKFAELATKHSKDPGSASNGGLYSQLTKDYGFIEDFENWYVDESRQIGDTGLVKNTQSSVQGYHIMYFASREPIWLYETKAAILGERTTALMEDAKAKWPMEVNYKAIVLGNADMSTF